MNKYNLYKLKLYYYEYDVNGLISNILNKDTDIQSSASWINKQTIFFSYFNEEEILILKLKLPADTEYAKLDDIGYIVDEDKNST